MKRMAIDYIVTTNQYEMWETVIVKRQIESISHKNDIAESWRRCLQKQLDPYNSINHNITTKCLDRAEYSRKLMNVAKPYLTKLYDTVKGMDVVIFLTDRIGTIIDIIGDKNMIHRAESVALIRGSSCTEDTIGTTSLGICLYTQKAAQVSQLEHYCQLYHGWNCTAVPIFDHKQQFMGTINISYDNPELHNNVILGLLDTAAYAIEKEFQFQSLHRVVEMSRYYYGKILDSVSEPLLVINSEGTVAHVNQSASNIYCTTPLDLIGKPVDSIIENSMAFSVGRVHEVSWKELNLLTVNGIIKVDSLLRPIKNEQSKNIGLVVTLKDIKENKNAAKYTFDDYIHRNSNIAMLIERAKNVSLNNITVLIQGESGTGKELIAQSIHNYSPRKQGPFIAVNCAALPKELIQSELFGYEDGAFTGAKKGGKAGKFELAHGGTLFLDEIGDMPLDAQANLLRVLQEKCVTRVGGSKQIILDVRVIAATNRNLENEVDSGHFRHDLYYRLSVVSLMIPPLRERREDIELLLYRFLKEHASTVNNYEHINIEKNALVQLLSYNWPGNIRELENAVIYLLTNLNGIDVTVKDLPPNIRGCHPGAVKEIKTLAEVEKAAVLAALGKCNNNITQTSKELGISRVTLYKKIKQICPLLHS